uniref:Uncharacterized protein n=1 Tax=Branchiostoma floridae TaxID=7739 RepID=C3XT19_BRAFL|eukprot:XP_002612743.1 hypothetical protein BRAFLDRAFT_97277 [Branchiostoma floridae]
MASTTSGGEETQFICFRLTWTQIEWMRGLFAAEEWGWPEVSLPPDFHGELVDEMSDSEAYTSTEEDDAASTPTISHTQETATDSSSDDDEGPGSCTTTRSGEQGAQQDPEPGPSRSTTTTQHPECPDCFLRPCITAFPASKIGETGAMLHRNKPRRGNASIRRAKYKKFWGQIKNSGGWKDERYLARKLARMRADNITSAKRELMPDCVVKLPRFWVED